MIRDANADPRAPEGRADVCILGGGPAGITIALRLAAAGRRVVLLEGGGLEFSGESQELYEGRNLGVDYLPLDVPRLRYLGGTTGHWGGVCFRFDPFDFEPRADVPLTGWPIGFDDLDPYAGEAARLLGTGGFGTLRSPADEAGTLDILDKRFSSDRPFHDIRSNEPVRFGTTYRAELAAAPGIEVLLNATATGLEIAPDSGRVAAAEYQTFAGGSGRIEAGAFVLAMGGLETSRFLLHLNRLHGDRLGNQGGMVGRCFMEHPVIEHGHYFVTRRLYSHSPTWELERLVRRAIPELVVGPSRAFALANGTMSASVNFGRLNDRPLPQDADAPPFLAGLEHGRDYFFTGQVWTVGEQAPNPDSRVVLLDQTDRFGIPRAGLDLRLQPRDLATLRESTVEAGRMLMRSGLGRMQMDPALWAGEAEALPIDWYNHHLGGARMSATPATGVVDGDCRVHGSPNLYVGGSGVFATGSHANPTFTIVQIALRLADHLAAERGA